ncbi:MAG: xanthine dehydrogenase family protein, partial [Syntrophorhabdales bacterium]
MERERMMDDEKIFNEEEMFDNMVFDKAPLERYNNIGKRGIRRLDGFEKASGRAIYTMDMQLPGMVYGRFFTSPYPHAEIKRLETGRAESLPGVRCVLRYDDPELPALADLGGHPPSAVPVLPKVAHFEGEEVGAFVVADTEDIAEEALRLIEVEWDVRPFLLHTEEALKPGAPLSDPEEYPDSNHYNEGFMDVTQRGDIAKGFAEADVVVEFRSERLHHTWIGP